MSIRYVYVHIPFCEVICHYCHFYTARAAEARDQGPFFRALGLEANRALPDLAPELEAIYFGGGTPGASPPEKIANFLQLFGNRISPQTEITLETNPSNVTKERARAWRDAGVNRLSLGVQSLDDPTLKRLGRAHTADEARRAVEICGAEIPNLSCDLIYAVPEQPEGTPAAHALELHHLGARHLSLYHLTLEKNHFLHANLPSDTFAWNQLRHVADTLEPLGFRHYEVASFALPGAQSRNNMNYWSGGPYLAFGPSAHGFDGNLERWSHVSDWREYERRAEAGESTRAWTEQLTDEQRRIEVIFTRLRTSSGLDLDAFARRFGSDLRETHRSWILRWEKEGLAKVEESCLVLTFSGKMLLDEIARALI
ncbi:MAG: radical SAM family heme chaperone HemW [Bdellovibrionota bacterium]